MIKHQALHQSAPNVAGSHRFDMEASRTDWDWAYLYLDMLRLLTIVGEHEKATFENLKAWHSDVKTYMEFHYQA